MNRRTLITGLGALLAAPAIVRASNIMPVKAWAEPVDHGFVEVLFDNHWQSFKCAEAIDWNQGFYIDNKGLARLSTSAPYISPMQHEHACRAYRFVKNTVVQPVIPDRRLQCWLLSGN